MPNGYTAFCALRGLTKYCPDSLGPTDAAVNNPVWGWVCKSCAGEICPVCGSFKDNPYHVDHK